MHASNEPYNILESTLSHGILCLGHLCSADIEYCQDD